MKRMHVMLRVADLDASISFYTALFGEQPGKRKTDYARWMLDDPPLNFSIAQTDDAHGIEHLGIQAETPDELSELRTRIDAAGGTVINEGQTTCCYANSDKTWIVDAQGVPWEAFYTSGNATTYHADADLAPPLHAGIGACCEPEASCC